MRPLIASVIFGLIAAPAMAQTPDWLTRCNQELSGSNDPETGKYLYQTRGKVAAPAQAVFDYGASPSRTAVIYPTEAKDFLNPFSAPSLNLSYFGAVDATGKKAMKPALGQLRLGTIGKDFKAVPGSPLSVKLVVNGKALGPWPLKESGGMYSVWIDTETTDGDGGKPPLLPAKEFAKIAKAVDGMTTGEIQLIQDGKAVATVAVPLTKFAAWRDSLGLWAAGMYGIVGTATSCRGGNIVN